MKRYVNDRKRMVGGSDKMKRVVKAYINDTESYLKKEAKKLAYAIEEFVMNELGFDEDVDVDFVDFFQGYNFLDYREDSNTVYVKTHDSRGYESFTIIITPKKLYLEMDGVKVPVPIGDEETLYFIYDDMEGLGY